MLRFLSPVPGMMGLSPIDEDIMRKTSLGVIILWTVVINRYSF